MESHKRVTKPVEILALSDGQWSITGNPPIGAMVVFIQNMAQDLLPRVWPEVTSITLPKKEDSKEKTPRVVQKLRGALKTIVDKINAAARGSLAGHKQIPVIKIPRDEWFGVEIISNTPIVRSPATPASATPATPASATPTGKRLGALGESPDFEGVSFVYIKPEAQQQFTDMLESASSKLEIVQVRTERFMKIIKTEDRMKPVIRDAIYIAHVLFSRSYDITELQARMVKSRFPKAFYKTISEISAAAHAAETASASVRQSMNVIDGYDGVDMSTVSENDRDTLTRAREYVEYSTYNLSSQYNIACSNLTAVILGYSLVESAISKAISTFFAIGSAVYAEGKLTERADPGYAEFLYDEPLVSGGAGSATVVARK